MAFMLGAFTSGLSGGLKNGMDLYKEYSDIRSKKDLSDSLTKAMNDKTPAAPAGAAPGQATAQVSSDSAASAPKSPSPDLNADPRTSKTAAALGAFGNAMSDSAMSAPGRSPYGNAKSDSAMSAPQGSGQGQAVATGGVEGNPAGDVWPSTTAPTQQAGTQQPTTSQSPWMDWILGRNPQNRAVHLTPSMGIATGPGSSSTPMSTSPGGSSGGSPAGRPIGASVRDWTAPAPPQYLPPQQNPQAQTPQGGRPPALSGAPTPGAPSLANQQNPIGQAIQTQYGNGGV